MERFKGKDKPCVICGGNDRDHRGQGERCYGLLSTDGLYAHCTRESFAGGMPVHIGKGGGQTYAHKLNGPCKCGRTHGDALPRGEVRAIGESQRAKVVATYDYHDAKGNRVYQVVRREPKGFQQRRPDGQGGWTWDLKGVEPLLYRLPRVIAAVGAGDPIWIPEGESDVHALEAAGQVATCNSGGAGKFPAAMVQHLAGADVVICRDKDEPGHKHARDVFAKLRGVAKTVRVVEARKGKDARDHLEAGLKLQDFVQIWPAATREQDPVEWKRTILRTSLEISTPLRRVSHEEAMQRPDLPTWPTGLRGGARKLPDLRGVTIIAGGPSAGKSYLSIASSMEAALASVDEWDVLYVAAEMGEKQIARRAERYARSRAPSYLHDGKPPANWQMLFVDFGADIEPLIEIVCEHATPRRLLVVFDSITSFVDQAKAAPNLADPHGIGLLRRLVMWAMNVKRKTDGEISFLILSELNKDGRTKGLFGDHKADLVIAMESDPQDNLCKHIRVVKAWEYETGDVGGYMLDIGRAALVNRAGPPGGGSA